MSKPIIVLTPVKNESWILPLFCASTSIWADYIVIANQKSTDNSREIAEKFSKVILIENSSTDLDENHRDRILVEKARELAGCNAILFRLDADEILTPNFNSPEWKELQESPAGTFWRFNWLQIYPGFKKYWENGTAFGAFVDDGRPYNGHGIIHAREIFPPKEDDEVRIATQIGFLHYQFVDWARMQSKHRYYQCFEHINFPNKSAIDIYRTYHWMYNPTLLKRNMPIQWIEDYKKYGVDILDITIENEYWWDKKVEEYLTKYTPKYFCNIETYKPGELIKAKGKGFHDKMLLFYLRMTTSQYNRKQGRIYKVVHRIDKFLQNKLHL